MDLAEFGTVSEPTLVDKSPTGGSQVGAIPKLAGEGQWFGGSPGEKKKPVS